MNKLRIIVLLVVLIGLSIIVAISSIDNSKNNPDNLNLLCDACTCGNFLQNMSCFGILFGLIIFLILISTNIEVDKNEEK